jgi:hypothetical protein
MLKSMLTAALVAGTALATTAPADAAQGCGRGYHRGPAGHCRPNGYRAPGVRLVIGNYYGGRGYWDGRRYYQHRYRHHGGWRYR